MAFCFPSRPSGFARIAAAVVAVLAAANLVDSAIAQQQRARIAPPAGFRKLAPGVETTMPRPLDPHDTVTYHNIVELLAPGVVPDLELDAEFQPADQDAEVAGHRSTVLSHRLVSPVHVQAVAAD